VLRHLKSSKTWSKTLIHESHVFLTGQLARRVIYSLWRATKCHSRGGEKYSLWRAMKLTTRKARIIAREGERWISARAERRNSSKLTNSHGSNLKTDSNYHPMDYLRSVHDFYINFTVLHHLIINFSHNPNFPNSQKLKPTTC